MLQINQNKNARLLKEKTRQGVIVGILFIVCSFLISFFNIEILYKVVSKVNVENMISNSMFGNKVGYYFIDITQGIFSLANKEPMMIWLSLGVIIGFGVLAMIIGSFIHKFLLFDFEFFGLGSKPVARISIDLLIGLILLSIVLLFLTGIKAIFVIWFALLLYYLFAVLILTLISMMRLIRLEKYN